MTTDLTATRIVHAGTEPAGGRSLCPAVHQSSVYYAKSIAEAVALEEMTEGIGSYSRVANPTVQTFESAMAEIEGGERALAAPSGMGALTLVFLTLLTAQDRVIVSLHSYADTVSVLRELSSKIGFQLLMTDVSNPKWLEELARFEPTIVVVESPTNPMLQVVDIPNLARQLKEIGAVLVVDNTLASPINQRPLELGADIVVHSASKYLSGHSNVVAGVIIGDAAMIERIHHVRTMTGICLDPHSAWLVLQGLQTLDLRVRAQNETAFQVAEFLATHPGVEFVFYPGLASGSAYEIAVRQMTGFGGIIAFGPRLSTKGVVDFLESLKLCTLAVSLGGTKTLIEAPALMSHAQGGTESLSVIPRNALRLSVGLENAQDIIEDIARALDAPVLRLSWLRPS